MGKVKDEKLFLLIRNYLTIYLPTQRNASAHTIRSYRTTWNQFLSFLADRKKIRLSSITFEMITYDMVVDYLNWLSVEQKLSSPTRNNRLAAIRAFLEYAAACYPEYISLTSQLASIKLQKIPKFSSVNYMSETAVTALLNSPDTRTSDGLRDQFFMVLLYDTGARIQEMLGIRLCDLKIGKTPTVTLHGKGNKIRTVPLMKDTVMHLKNYLGVFHLGVPMESKDYLFYVEHGGIRQQTNDDTIRYRLKRYAAIARETCPEVPENIHPHLWRNPYFNKIQTS